uniref:Protocadherin gamma-C5-like n=1 Tax=Paramormyrops kingsleyae TaxID=1676925 RepID=A0A3B3T7B4_9TELE|nr:protocadherin gamma-A3-like isoform X1 [Paramormyrops kingsleyae]
MILIADDLIILLRFYFSFTFCVENCKMYEAIEGIGASNTYRRRPFSRFHWQALVFFMSFLSRFAHSQIRYSIPEEMKKGTFIGNIAQDLDLDLKRLRTGNARVIAGDHIQYTELDIDKGVLVVRERIDREELCGEVSPCSFSFDVILENPMELHHIIIEILDVNDNAPMFKNDEIKLEISESAAPGARFVLGSADDPDVGFNTLQNYVLTPLDNFILKQHANPGGGKYAEMILQKSLDRELHPRLSLRLIALDGGNPPKSGTMNIEVTVLDANDNPPTFNQSLYKAIVFENASKGAYITTVKASDADSGSNGIVTYSFSHLKKNVADTFSIDENTGKIFVSGQIDYEKTTKYEIGVEAKDKGGLADSAKVVVEVVDVNDNSPVINIMSFSSPVPEDATPGTTVAILNVKDIDSGENGQISCSTDSNLPFKMSSSLKNYYTLVTNSELDREKTQEYNITVVASDAGTPPLLTKKVLKLKVSDVNDNAPVFSQESYMSYVVENNSPGASICVVQAQDADSGANARVSYVLEETHLAGTPISSYISVNSESGIIYAIRSLDYEHIKQFKLVIKAQDGGAPPLSSNVTVNIIIQDQNDNTPQILYPVHTGGSLVPEMVPRSAEVGYLVTKVVAIDVDSGQNAWLSYTLLKTPDRPLFEVGLQNGEIRTIRQISDKDAVKQKLTVIVEDNGQPPRSATVIVNVAVADSFPEILSEFSDTTGNKDYNENLTFYLVLALAVVSFLFILSLLVIISVKIYRWRKSRLYYQSNLPVIPYYPPLYADVGGTGTLQRVYNYDVCSTTDSRKSDCRFVRPCSQSALLADNMCTMKMQHVNTETNLQKDPDPLSAQKPPNTDWRFSQNQRPGPSGCSKLESAELRWTSNKRTRAGVPPEGAVGTGPWPNPPTEAEQLQALMAAANEVSEATATLGPGTMGLSTRYSPQFTLQHVPDYRQNVYIPGSTATLTANPQQQALPPPQAQAPPPTQAEAPKAAQTPASKKKSAKKEKK